MPPNFWKNLKKPFFATAPMANVTDAAFRHMFALCGKPDIFWTEFVSIEGLLSRGKESLLIDLWFEKAEHPIVAQIFGTKPEQFAAAAALVRNLGFDGIDINMGCPDRDVEKQGAGATLIKDPSLAKAIIRATKEGAGNIPVSVKTRIGYATDEIDTWIPTLLEEDIAALTVHLRTRNEMSDTVAKWDLAPKIVALRDHYAPNTLLIGNGDISSIEEARARVAESGMDGAMIGRGIFGNPWFFSGHIPGLPERLDRMVEHAEYFEKIYKSNKRKKRSEKEEGNGLKNFDIMKKHFKAYVSGFPAAKELRIKLMETKNAADVRRVTEEFLTQYSAAPTSGKEV